MLDSVPSIAAFATQLSNQKTGQQLEVAVLNKAKELQEQQGQAALKLLESAAAPAGGIDVRV
ncbi:MULTISPECIES: YjfB family protein [unclassified Methylomonas]|uniref:YjfB family protein n=1 Tax=unclassified Methylomonas TaxID=2608980 RepID=UPI0008D97B56|nr:MULTISPECIES: YjfB family protein [unclassified Methylomonas]NJA04749.1 putative motility protein [Methylococcaceae bacterium WWC4]OHX34288.1 hypothetical protein BJL95_03865 [Methylomonas sp. LWB]WGS86142.1 YjfB family protein [Methylomonas sp. UP202]